MIAATTLSFDISVLELLLPLTVGAQVAVVDREVAVDPVRLATAMKSATVAQGTPTMWKMLVDSGWTCEPDFTILCGGEALPRDLGRALVERSSSVWNMYGPTETTVWSAVARLDDRDPVGPFFPLGEPIDNTRLYVLDGEHLAPDGVAGELWIGGAGVARGYLTPAELTAERFRPDPFFGVGERMYRTGDLVRRDPDGALCFLGRADGQIKLRGHRIELGEIESVLARHEQVDQAIVVVREFGEGDERLVGYVTRDRSVGDGADVDTAGVRSLARDGAACVHGACDDRRNRSVPADTEQQGRPQRAAEPRVRTEPALIATRRGGTQRPLTAVLQTYREILGGDRVAADDDFFDLGGHSILATRMCSRLQRSLDGDVSVRTVFENPTPRSLARAIDGRGPVITPAREGGHLLDAAPARTESPAMSFSQERMLFIHQLDPSDTSYNLAGAVRVDGRLDLDALRQACSALVERHSGLRSTFDFDEGQPRLVIHEPYDCNVAVTDWSDAVDVDPLATATSSLAAAARTPFDLRQLPLFRVELHLLPGHTCVIGVVMHHIISDQWSFGVLARELGELYRAARTGRARRTCR